MCSTAGSHQSPVSHIVSIVCPCPSQGGVVLTGLRKTRAVGDSRGGKGRVEAGRAKAQRGSRGSARLQGSCTRTGPHGGWRAQLGHRRAGCLVGARAKTVFVGRKLPRVCACSVVSNSLQPRGLQPARLPCPWDLPGQNVGRGWPFPPLGDLPDPGIEPRSPALAEGFFTTNATGDAHMTQQSHYWAYTLRKP